MHVVPFEGVNPASQQHYRRQAYSGSGRGPACSLLGSIMLRGRGTQRRWMRREQEGGGVGRGHDARRVSWAAATSSDLSLRTRDKAGILCLPACCRLNGTCHYRMFLLITNHALQGIPSTWVGAAGTGISVRRSILMHGPGLPMVADRL